MTDLVQQACDEMDEALTSVMPDHWFGHARARIAAEGFDSERRTFAERLAERVLEKHDVTAERAAELSIDKTREKLEA